MKKQQPQKMVKVSRVVENGFYLQIDDSEIFVSFEKFGIFREVTLADIFEVEYCVDDSLHWENADIDIDIDAFRHPEKYVQRFPAYWKQKRLEENANCPQPSKLISLPELQKKNNKQGRGRQNLLGKRLPGMEYLPINICRKDGETLHFELNQMPHLMIAGGTSDTQAAVVRKILEGWENCTWIEPVVIDLTGKLVPEKTADSETALMDKIREMTGILECRYDELAAMKIKSAGAYLDQEHYDMPFHPVIVLGFEKVLSTIPLPDDIVTPFRRLAQKGRAAGINLILCSTDTKILNGIFAANCPAKLVFHSADANDFSFSDMVIPKINRQEANAYLQEYSKRHTGVKKERELEFPEENDRNE